MRFFLFDKYLYANCSAERIVELNRKKTVEKQEKIRNNMKKTKYCWLWNKRQTVYMFDVQMGKTKKRHMKNASNLRTR